MCPLKLLFVILVWLPHKRNCLNSLNYQITVWPNYSWPNYWMAFLQYDLQQCAPPSMVLFIILVRLAHKRNGLNSLNLPSHGGPILSIRSDITCENSPYRFSDKQCHDSGQNFWSYHQFGWERVVHPKMLFSVFSPLGFRNNKILDKIGPYFISQYWQNALTFDKCHFKAYNFFPKMIPANL